MKLSLQLLLTLPWLGCYAFPNMSPKVLAAMKAQLDARALEEPEVAKLMQRQNPLQVSSAETNCGPTPCLVFSEADQYVSTTGQYAYASPAADEIRGPCPGLNAAANHGYLPRSGVASIPETIAGLGALYNMSPDLAGFLAAYAIAFDGDVVTGTWSIGGPQPALTVGGLLGQPQGISYSHNKYEGDTSIGRNDAYLGNGDAHSLNVTRFKLAYETGLSDDRYTLDRFRQDVVQNQYNSIANNPYYFAPLFSTTLVAPAAYNFVINFMSNHSAAEPSGYLNGAMFKQWFAVTGTYPNFAWQRGQEQIPTNWYRRPTSNQYNAADVVQDLLIGWEAYPESFRFGGNTNGVNTYAGVNIENLTGGTYNAQSLFQGNNFGCFFFQTQQQAVPDVLKGGVNDVAVATALIAKYSAAVFGQLTCPTLAKYDSSLFNVYPGRTYSPTGPATNY